MKDWRNGDSSHRMSSARSLDASYQASVDEAKVGSTRR